MAEGSHSVFPDYLPRERRVCTVCGKKLVITREALEFRWTPEQGGSGAHCSCLPRARVRMVGG